MSGQSSGQLKFRREVFRAELARRKLRPIHIAMALDVDTRTVTRWLEPNGPISPNGSNARRLARHFGYEEDFFLDDYSDDPDPLPTAA